MNKRVLLVVDTMFPLGPANQLKLLANELVQRGLEVHVAVLKDRPFDRYPLPSNCQVHYLEIKKRDWMAWSKLRRLANSIRPDVCHDWSAESITRAAIGDLFPHVSSQYCDLAGPIEWSNWIRQQLTKRRTIAPTQFAVTHELLANRLTERGISNDRVTVVSPAVGAEDNPQDARQFVLEEFGLPNDSLIVGAYAPLVPATRFKDCIWAVDLLSCIRDDVQLLIMGTGTQLSRLQRFLRCTRVRPRVRFVGLPADPLQVIAGLDVYWNSHLQWPLPISMLLAMQFGVPAVSVHGPETDQVIIHQTTGFCVNLGARDEFARWTKYLVEQKEPAKQLARQGQQHVENLFPVEPFVDAYLNLYESF